MVSRAAAAIMLFFVFLSAHATGLKDWTEYESPEHGFAASFPQTPHSTQKTTGQGSKNYTRYTYEVERGDQAYIVNVFEYAPGVLPEQPDEAFFTTLVNTYSAAGNSVVREQHPHAIAGHWGMEAVADDVDGTVSHLMDVAVVGNRLYLVISAGPRGSDVSDEAIHFRDSFRLLEKTPESTAKAETR